MIRNQGLQFGDAEFHYKNSETRVDAIPYRQFVANHSDQTAYFQPVLDLLQHRPGFLERVDPLVLVEGKSDYYILRLLLESAGLPQREYSLYPGGGAGSLDNAISLYCAWARPFLVLLDSDKEGVKQRTRYIERFSPLIDANIFTIRSVGLISSTASIEAVLSSDDLKSLSMAAFGEIRDLSKKDISTAAYTCLSTRRTITLRASNRMAHVLR